MMSMEDCIFCKIVKGDIPCAKVYEDDLAFSFMTIEAINEGHLLVIPKKHVQSVDEMDETTYLAVMKMVRNNSVAVKKAFSPKKIGLVVQGWDVPHAHVHVVPMNDHNDITSKKTLDNTMLMPSSEELVIHAGKIKEELNT